MLAIVLAFLFVVPSALLAQTQSDFATAEGVVRELYDLVTFEAGTTPDWDRVRSTFLDEAVVVLRTSREATTVFTVDGFVQDFAHGLFVPRRVEKFIEPVRLLGNVCAARPAPAPRPARTIC